MEQCYNRLEHTEDVRMALFPPVLLDAGSTGLLCVCDPETGHDLLAHAPLGLEFSPQTCILEFPHLRSVGHPFQIPV